ncbi:MAG TPA: hypothetical protein VHO06_07865 [Polyangia bacterium]|nr:hypothetical protein [Polyangia bacterium]
MVAVGACSTTHDLGPAADPATMSRIEALASEPGTTASVTPLPGRHGLHPTYAVTAATANGLMVSVGGDPPALLSYDRVRSLNRRDRLHGARNGGLAVAAVAFAVGFIVGAGATAFPACCAPPPSPARIGLEVGGVSALVGAVVGGAFGALAGYQDRYVLAPTETASAR